MSRGNWGDDGYSLLYGHPINYFDDGFWVYPDGPKRSKLQYPYSYSEFYLFGHKDVPHDDAAYSDRMEMWDYEKYHQLWKEHVGAHFTQAGKARMTAFMSGYWGRKVECTAMAEGCNVSNGYPYYIVWWKELEKKP